MTEDPNARGGVQVIARAAAILHALEGEPEGLSLAQIAARVGLPRSTVQRLVVALAEEGFLSAASPKERVRLGPALARLGAAARRDIREELEPFLRDLAERFEETVDLAILDRDKVRILAHIESPHLLRAVSVEGAELPLHSTANGKAFLAALPEHAAAKLLQPRLARFTPETITKRADLMAELKEVRATGVAYSREENTIGVSAVGATVFDSYGPAAGITVIVPAERFTKLEGALATAVLAVTREATESLGGSLAALPAA